MSSIQKGKNGERELASFLRQFGLSAERGQQHAGGADAPDVRCPALERKGIHIECKRVEKLELYGALVKAEEEAGPLKRGVVFHRRNREAWQVTLSADAFLTLLGHKPKETRIRMVVDE